MAGSVRISQTWMRSKLRAIVCLEWKQRPPVRLRAHESILHLKVLSFARNNGRNNGIVSAAAAAAQRLVLVTAEFVILERLPWSVPWRGAALTAVLTQLISTHKHRCFRDKTLFGGTRRTRAAHRAAGLRRGERRLQRKLVRNEGGSPGVMFLCSFCVCRSPI